MEQFVKIKNLDIFPQKSLIVTDKNKPNFDMLTIYNLIVSASYEINEKNIDEIIKHTEWQIATAYGMVLSFIFPDNPFSMTNILFGLYNNDDISLDVDYINEIFHLFLNFQNKRIKFIVFKSLIFLVFNIISNEINKHLKDKELEENILNFMQQNNNTIH